MVRGLGWWRYLLVYCLIELPRALPGTKSSGLLIPALPFMWWELTHRAVGWRRNWIICEKRWPAEGSKPQSLIGREDRSLEARTAPSVSWCHTKAMSTTACLEATKLFTRMFHEILTVPAGSHQSAAGSYLAGESIFQIGTKVIAFTLL